MKTIPIALAPQYAGAGSTLCACLKIIRADDVVVGFTSLDRSLTVDGVLYKPGFEPSEIVQTSGLAVDDLELTILPDSPSGLLVERDDLIAGLWDDASFVIFETNWKDPTDGINVLKRGTMGNAQTARGSFTIELRGLKLKLSPQLGAATSKTCRARFGDENCRLDIADFTFDYPTTAVDGTQPARIFTCAGAVEADEYYNEGTATANDGPNTGYTRKIKSFAAGVFTLQIGFPRALGVGDSITFTAGCQKRLTEDCKTKFDNVLNFYGEPDVPGNDKLLADPEVDAPS